MIAWIKENVKFFGAAALFLALAVVVIVVLREIDSRNDRIADLTTKLITTEQTREIEKGLYAKKLIEVDDLKDLISKLGEDNERLGRLIKDGQVEVIALNQLVIQWKRAYEAVVAAHQSEEPPVVPGDPPRKRVDFEGAVGPISVIGHTLTDPPQAFLKWTQIDPLRITVALTKNKDGTYSTIVDTSSDEISVDIKNAVLDLSSLRPKWYQRFWLDVGADALGERSANVGLTYLGDRHGLGLSCRLGEESRACGASYHLRLFK